MKNILLLVPRMNIGGAESYVALVARSLKLLGYNVYLASAGGALATKLQQEGIKHFFLPIRLSKFISGLLLKRIVEKYNIDLIHANSEAAGIVAVKTRNKYKLDIPIVYTAHGVLPAKVKDIINQVDKIIAVSEFSRKSAIKEGFLAEKIQVIYNGVDTDKFKPNRQNKNLLRKKYNIPQEAFTMIIVSRIKNLRNKGHQHLLDVLKNYEVSKKWHLVVIGKGKGFSDLKKKIKEYHLQDRVHLLGHKTDVENYIDIADVMVLPSYFETFGLVLAEGMAMEKPAVAFKVGGVPEVIEDNKTGFVVDYDNDDELVEKLAILAKNPDLCKQMGIQARKKVAKDFANRIMIKKLEEIYKSL
ncbi:glycosyltransferase family 4 protein [Megamonas funiformis]|uniref:glycosyltransferase family 4 protein n=1 Tax=Megamonas funiformis TaxID=437897 RepID=UPI001CD2A79C|nr:glycosyltransferase family 4 protein [Megamonas funiformis]UBS48186.1 glycosyltransferase family 4 protein [Megamonas funiformis]GLU99228.1 mannosyltransferase [Megamonas funiformis]